MHSDVFMPAPATSPGMFGLLAFGCLMRCYQVESGEVPDPQQVHSYWMSMQSWLEIQLACNTVLEPTYG